TELISGYNKEERTVVHTGGDGRTKYAAFLYEAEHLSAVSPPLSFRLPGPPAAPAPAPFPHGQARPPCADDLARLRPLRPALADGRAADLRERLGSRRAARNRGDARIPGGHRAASGLPRAEQWPALRAC